MSLVERYALEPLKSLWTLEAQYRRWLEVELAVVEAYEEIGVAPKGTADRIRERAVIDVEKFLRIEEEVRHDVIAFIKGITEKIGDEARYFHYGLTSSDVVDTALSLALVRSYEVLINDLKGLINSLKRLAKKTREMVVIGRTHGVHAEPTSFGLKVLSWLSEMERNLSRLERAKEEIGVGKISGAVGNYANIDPRVEEIALSKLGLKREKVSTQVVCRDRHAFAIATLAILGGSIERLAVEIRHLQRTEVLEAQEPFRKGQRGSSAMPHKKNPILCERLSGMSRLLRSYSLSAFENMALWHERDISHSSVERYIFPDATMTAHYILVKAKELIDGLILFPERMKRNIWLTKGLVFSQRVMLSLVKKGMSREKAYKAVQRIALDCWENGSDFVKAVKSSPEIRKYLSDEDIKTAFDSQYYLRHVDEVFSRFDM